MERISGFDIIIVGSGAAGLSAALGAEASRVLIITKTPTLESGSTFWAQGGMAAAVAPNDSSELHTSDTLIAGAGLCNREAVEKLTENGPAAVKFLESAGVLFDREQREQDVGPHSLRPYSLSREGSHSKNRILHAGGDATGRSISLALAEKVRNTPRIEVLTETLAWKPVIRRGAVTGLIAYHREKGPLLIEAHIVIIASGGAGRLFPCTTNPPESTGDGLAMALRTGLGLRDMEMIQFHPTAMKIKEGDGQVPLLTEALRGAGARLINSLGSRFMCDRHEMAELAPRDIVSREIWNETFRTGDVFLDLSYIANLKERFPTVYRICQDHGYQPDVQPVPVRPAAHYFMGGIPVDLEGRSAIEGLYAFGEAASTGVHGANRLASNSLLECVVFARRNEYHAGSAISPSTSDDVLPMFPDLSEEEAGSLIEKVQQIADRSLGVVRSLKGLETARSELLMLKGELKGRPHTEMFPSHTHLEALNLLRVALYTVEAAHNRRKSCGAHYLLASQKSSIFESALGE